jgi:hypothetical protein
LAGTVPTKLTKIVPSLVHWKGSLIAGVAPMPGTASPRTKETRYKGATAVGDPDAAVEPACPSAAADRAAERKTARPMAGLFVNHLGM